MENVNENQLSWYDKIYKYLKNRNQIIPEKIQLPESDFLIISQRRTIRIIKPTQKCSEYYDVVDENLRVNENFISKWIKRPHSMNNCRCSFRHAIKLNSINKQKQLDVKNEKETDRNDNLIETTVKSTKVNDYCYVKTNENVKSIENYIDELLRDIFDETMRSIFIKNQTNLKKEFDLSERLLDVKFKFPIDERRGDDFTMISEPKGYINQGFLGSPYNPDCLNYSKKPIFLSEKLDSDDSGINSVETMDFHPAELDLDFEESLMKIIDAKFNQVSFVNRNDKKIDEVGNVFPVEGDVGEHLQNDSAVDSIKNISDGNLTSSFKQEEVSGDKSKESELKDVNLLDDNNYQLDSSSVNQSVRRIRKPMIIFLHGFGSSAEVFHNQLVYFSEIGYPCIAPDMLGHGLSSAPNRSRDYHFDKLLNDVETVFQHYALESGQKCVLVAHNYGCSFATALAQKYEDKIIQLVLISGGGPTPLAPPNAEGPGYYCLRFGLTPFLMCGLRRNILYSARGRQHPYCDSESINQWPSHMKYILNGMSWPAGDHIFHKKINTPTLLIHGLRDDKVSLVQQCQMERTLVKAFLEAIPTAGHIPMVDTPQQVNHMIHCFIDLWEKNV